MVTAGSDADVMAANEFATHVALQVKCMLCIFDHGLKDVSKNPEHVRFWGARVSGERGSLRSQVYVTCKLSGIFLADFQHQIMVV